ncbi:MAG: hypothetical protein AB1582_07305 [Pseudomonadota bacterium]
MTIEDAITNTTPDNQCFISSLLRFFLNGAQLLQLQRDVDVIVGETLHLYDEGSIEEGELAPLSLAIELFNHAMTERRAALQIGPIEPT